MTWSRFDDGYDEHDKIDDAWFAFPPNPVGLHVQATTACNRWLSDGVIKPRWITYKLPDTRQRGQILAAMVEHGLFDLLSAGESRVVADSDDTEIAVGPFSEDRYIVHDFLQRHDSSVQTKARRAVDAERKRIARLRDSNRSPVGRGKDSPKTPPVAVADSVRSPLTGGSAGAPPHPFPALPVPEEEDEESRDARRGKVAEVCALLKSDTPFLSFDELSVLRLIERGERSDLAPLDLATSAIALARRYERDGTLRTSSAESLMKSILDRRETSAAAQLAAAGARAVADAEGRSRQSSRRSAADEEIARMEKLQDELQAREAAEQTEGRAA